MSRPLLRRQLSRQVNAPPVKVMIGSFCVFDQITICISDMSLHVLPAIVYTIKFVLTNPAID